MILLYTYIMNLSYPGRDLDGWMIGDGRRPARLNRFLFRNTSRSKTRNRIRSVCARVVFGTVFGMKLFSECEIRKYARCIAHIHTYHWYVPLYRNLYRAQSRLGTIRYARSKNKHNQNYLRGLVWRVVSQLSTRT